jgi:regulation of enolase protein 1 (concanavalin A-like superfamily)
MSNLARRTFIARSAGLVLTALAGASGQARTAGLAGDANVIDNDLIGRMRWLNEPASWKRTGDAIAVRSRPKTDFWRKTFYGYITDSGHFLYASVSGDFTFEARISGEFSAQYDQAGLMIRLDAENWMKCGTEVVDGVRHASVVFTRDYSDWSAIKGVTGDGPVWWRAVRKAESLETLYSVDGKTYTSIRLGYLVPAAEIMVGVMCASPEGSGFDCVFERLALDRPAGQDGSRQ